MNFKNKKGKKKCLNIECQVELPINQNICPKCKFFNKKDYNSNNSLEDLLNKKINKKRIKEIKDIFSKKLFSQYKNLFKEDKIYNINYNIEGLKINKIINNQVNNTYNQNIYNFNTIISYLKIIKTNKYNNIIFLATFTSSSNNETLKVFRINDIYINKDSEQISYLSINYNNNLDFNIVYPFKYKIIYIRKLFETKFELIFGLIYIDYSIEIFQLKKNELYSILKIKNNYDHILFYFNFVKENYCLFAGTKCGKIINYLLNFNNNINYNIIKIYNKNNNFCISGLDFIDENNFVISTLDGNILIYNIFESYSIFEFISNNKPINNLFWDISGNFIFFNDEFDNNGISCLFFSEIQSDKSKSYKKNFKFVNNIKKMIHNNDNLLIGTEEGYLYIFCLKKLRKIMLKPKNKNNIQFKGFFFDNKNKIIKINNQLIFNEKEKNNFDNLNNMREYDNKKIKFIDFFDDNKILFSNNNNLCIINI